MTFIVSICLQKSDAEVNEKGARGDNLWRLY